MPDAELDSTRHVGSVCEVPQAAGALQLPLPGVPDGVFIDWHWAVDLVDVTC